MMRRRDAFGAVLVTLAATLSATVDAAPLAVNLSVEVRFVPDAGDVPRSSRNSVVVGTQGSTPLAGSVSVTTATSAAPADDSLQQLRVLNGSAARVRLARLQPLRRVQWVWTAQGNGLSENTTWVDTVRGFELRPNWPGGDAPVHLEILADSVDEAPADASGHSAGPRRLQVSTTVQVPLGEWFAIGRVGRARPAADSDLTVSTTRRSHGQGRVEVRVLAP